MPKQPKSKVLALCFTILVASCTNQVQNLEFKTKSIDASPSPSMVANPNFKLPIPDKFDPLISSGNGNEPRVKINFDQELPDNLLSSDDQIGVIYKDSYKVRIDKKTKKLKIKSPEEKAVFDLLESNGLISSKDLGYDNSTDKEMDDLHEKVSREREGIPHLQSMHYYKFEKGADLKKLCKELRKNPLVRLAYPTPLMVPTATMTTLGVTQNNEANPSKPSDISFGYQESVWYWFNKHRIFKAWNYYGSTTVPNIAVIDTGFNVNSSELNFGDAYYVQNGSLIASTSLGNCPNKSCAQELSTENPQNTFSHGSIVASVAAGKKNNNIGLCGVAPGATITAIKTSGDSAVKAIEVAADNLSVDAINISSAFVTTGVNKVNFPLSQDTFVNAKITYAVIDKNKPVVITIGNNEVDPYNNDDFRDIYGNMISPVSSDALVIGGSEPSSISGKQRAWVTDDPDVPSLKGSNYNVDENTVSVTASAYRISCMAYQKVSGNEAFITTSGTSFAAPMISATLGMMRKLNLSLSAKKLQGILVYSANVYKYDNGTGGSSSKFLGRNLNDSSINQGKVSGIRDLNTYNALVIANNLSNPNYNAITRSYNIDDYVASKNDSSSSVFPYPGGTIDGYGNDLIYGFSSVNNYSYFNFSQYNNGSGGCTYGYQVYRKNFNDAIAFDRIGGVSGVASSTTCDANDWNSDMSYYYN